MLPPATRERSSTRCRAPCSRSTGRSRSCSSIRPASSCSASAGPCSRARPLAELLPFDSPLFDLIRRVGEGGSGVSDYGIELLLGRGELASGRRARVAARRAARRSPGRAAPLLGGAAAEPAAVAPRRRARGRRAGRDPGARGQEPALGDPRRGAAPGGQRRRGRAAADPADLRRDRPDLRPGRPHGGVCRRHADRAPPGQHLPGAGAGQAA